MQRKDTLDTFSVRDSAHGECFIESPALTANDYASKYLDSLFVPFHHAGMNAYAIPDRERCGVASVLFFLNGIDDLIHEKFPLPARPGGRTVSSRKSKIATSQDHLAIYILRHGIVELDP
jgi:hypothetical protein